MTNTRAMAEFVQGVRFEDLPGDVVEKAKQVVAHALGIQLATATLPWSRIVYEYAMSQGGAPEATVVRYGDKTSVTNAAYVNGSFAHAFELDDNHARTGIKGGSIAVPTAMAMAERQDASGKDVIAAIVAGYEVMTRVGLTIRGTQYARECHPTGTNGAFGAATIAARLLQLDVDRIVHALGGAANHMIGFSEVPVGGRGHIKRTFPGMANAGGIRAALLAEAGMTAPETMLEGGGGFLRGFDIGPEGTAPLTAGLGQEWEILRVHFKPWAQDGFIQPVTQALDQLREAHDFEPDDIDSIWVGTNSRACKNIAGTIVVPNSVTDAQFSTAFSVGLYLVTGGAGFREYTEQNLRDEQILDLAHRVRVEVDDEVEREYLKRRPRGAKVSITLRSGKTLHEYVYNLKEMSPSMLDEKFMGLATTAMDGSAAAALLQQTKQLDQLDHVHDVVTAVSTGTSHGCVIRD